MINTEFVWSLVRAQTALPSGWVNARQALNWLAFGSADDFDLIACFDAEKRSKIGYWFPNGALALALREAADCLDDADRHTLAGLIRPANRPKESSFWPRRNRELAHAREHLKKMHDHGEVVSLHRQYAAWIETRVDMKARFQAASEDLLAILRKGSVQTQGRPGNGTPHVRPISANEFQGSAVVISASSCLTAYGEVLYSDVTFDARHLIIAPKWADVAKKGGRPGGSALVETEMRRRDAAGKMLRIMAAEAQYLSDWLKREHPQAVQMKPKSIASSLRLTHRELCRKP